MLCLVFKSLSHFEFTFVCSNFIDLYVAVQLSQHHLVNRLLLCFFSIVQSCLLCQRSIDHRCVGLFLGYFVPLTHMSIFMPIPHCFDYCNFILFSKVWEGYASSFDFFLLWKFLSLSLFGFILFGTLCASCSWMSVSFFGFRKFIAIISSLHFQSSFVFLPLLGPPIMCRLVCFTLSHRSLMLLSFFSFGFLSAI